MAGHQKSQSVRIFLEKVENYNDQSLAAFLFPIDDSEAPRITQAIADDVRSSEELKKRVNQAFLLLMKGYGFYRRQVNPSVRIRLRPKSSKTMKRDAQTWLCDEHPEHGRIARIILLLRIFDLQDEAQAFFAALTSEVRITNEVSNKSQLQWRTAIDEDILEYLAENSSEDGNTSESSDLDSLCDESEPLSFEQQQLLERLIKEGIKKFAGRKRSRNNEEEGDDSEPPTKRQKTDQLTWDHVRAWLESYRNQLPALTWTRELHQRMAARRKAYKEAAATPDFKPIEKHSLPFMSDIIPLVIGSLWASLREKVPFGFGTPDLFNAQTRAVAANEPQQNLVAACGRRQPNFIIPIFSLSAAQAKDLSKGASHIGHLLLAVATKTSKDHDDARINIYNSLPAWFSDPNRNGDEETKAEVEEVLRLSKWLARPGNHQYQLTINHVTVPIQSTLAPACGLHTILTAWALLLGLPLHEHESRGGCLPEREFLALGTEIVNLAAAGYMDSQTTQTFLNASGVIVEQDVNDASIRVALVDTMRMTAERLREVVDERVLEEVSAAST